MKKKETKVGLWNRHIHSLISVLLVTILMLYTNSCSDNKTTSPNTPTSISINPESVTLDIGQTQQLTITPTPTNANPSVTWSSEIPSVATVSSSGEVTALAQGQAIITATSTINPNVTATRTVNVAFPAPTSIFINPESVTLNIGQSQQLTITPTPANANPSVTWSSGTPSVATVSTSGEVTALSEGQAIITAISTIIPSMTASIVVNVNPIPTATVLITIAHPDGGSVVGANVVLQNPSGGSYQQTASSLFVILTNIPYGTYSVTISQTGFNTYSYNSLEVEIPIVNHSALLTLVSPSYIGQKFWFGAYLWRVLDIQEGRALIISENILERRVYHTSNLGLYWSQSSLRTYLNGAFLNSNAFSAADRIRIAQVTIENPDNLTYGTLGGPETLDSIFLLSIDEAQQYFSSNSDRRAYYNGSAFWWWLRSPGRIRNYASFVDNWGGVEIGGTDVNNAGGGVRPALWLIL